MIKTVAVREAVRKAFDGKFLNIGPIADACRVLELPLYEGEDWAVLRALHCTRFEHLNEAETRELLLVVARVMGMSEVPVTLPEGLRLTA